MTYQIKNIRVLLFIVLSFSLRWLASAQEEAVVAFERGDYAEAARLYEGQLSEGTEGDANLYYNLAVCYAQMGHIVDAATHYERALYLNPTHTEARHNLKILYSRVKGSIPIERGMMQGLADSFCYAMPLSSWIVVGIVCFALSLALLYCFFLSQEIRTRRLLFYSALGLVLLSVLANAAIAHQWYYRKAIEHLAIVKQTQLLYEEPSKHKPTQVELHEGTPVEQLSSLFVWAEVRLTNGQKGWLPIESVQSVITERKAE